MPHDFDPAIAPRACPAPPTGVPDWRLRDVPVTTSLSPRPLRRATCGTALMRFDLDARKLAAAAGTSCAVAHAFLSGTRDHVDAVTLERLSKSSRALGLDGSV